MTNRGQSVGSLPALADPDEQSALVEHRIPVAELGGDVDLDRQPGPMLNGVFAHHRRVVGSPTGHYEDLVHGAEQLAAQLELPKAHPPGLVHPSPQGVRDRVRLFVDLLQHEVLVAALLGRLQIPLHSPHLDVERGAFEVGHRQGLGADLDHPVVLQHHHLPGEGQECGDIGGDEVLAIAAAHHQRAAPASSHHQSGLIAAYHGDG